MYNIRVALCATHTHVADDLYICDIQNIADVHSDCNGFFLSTRGFTLGEVQLLCSVLDEKFALFCYLHSKGVGSKYSLSVRS
jgi:hypothetical protein